MPGEINPLEENNLKPPEAHLTVLHCIGLVVLLGILQGFVVLFLSKIHPNVLNNPDWPDIILTTGIPGLLTAKAGAILAGLYLWPLLTKRFNYSGLVPLLFALFGLSIITSELSNVLQKVTPLPEEFDLFNKLSRENLFGVLLGVSVVVPITEELIFRGVMLEGLSQTYKLRTAFLVSALLFGLIHIHPWLMLNAFLLAFFLNWVKLKFGALLPCIFFHALYNGLPFILTRTPLRNVRGYTLPSGQEIQFQPLWFDALGLVSLLVGIAGIYLLVNPVEELSEQRHLA
jgi:membrane protease YdiL (CAAX protease family)